MVKIDNHPEARPQTGLNQADIVYEEMVEGITRFFAVFQSTDVDARRADPLGPHHRRRTRSAGLTEPLFAWSGGNRDVSSARSPPPT